LNKLYCSATKERVFADMHNEGPCCE